MKKSDRDFGIALIATSMYGWGGGRDLLLDFAKAFEYAIHNQNKNLNVKLYIPYKSWLRCFVLDVKDAFDNKRKISFRRYKEYKKNVRSLVNNINNYCPTIEIEFFYWLKYGFVKSRFLNAKLKKDGMEVCFGAPYVNNDNLCCPNIFYIPDFQHKYYPEYFDQREIDERNRMFEDIVMHAKYVMVTSENAKEDIFKFFPQSRCEVYVQPFAPVAIESWLQEKICDISKYNLPPKYFMICNQFWQHKDHITAFRALESIYVEGRHDLHIICTGEMVDHRNPQYIKDLKKEIEEMQCRNNIHMLGYIPKDDQIQIMKGAIALLQPTLYEGNPGGNSVLDAYSVGIPCIISDIEVNKEIAYLPMDEIKFFKKGDSDELRQRMQEAMLEKAKDSKKDLRSRMQYNKVLLACSICAFMHDMV